MRASRLTRAVILFGLAGTVGPLCYTLFRSGDDLLRDILVGIWPAWILALGLESQTEAILVTLFGNVLVFALFGALFSLSRTVTSRLCLMTALSIGLWFWFDFLGDALVPFLASVVFLLALITVLSLWDKRATGRTAA